MKTLVLLTALLMTTTTLAASRCQIDMNLLNDSGQINYNFSYYHGSDASLKKCFKQVNKVLEEYARRDKQIQITLNHDDLEGQEYKIQMKKSE